MKLEMSGFGFNDSDPLNLLFPALGDFHGDEAWNVRLYDRSCGVL